jgi:Flp pilus assembly protein TadD
VLQERLGFALLAAKDNREAERAFRRAIATGARVPSVWDGLAAALFRQGLRAEAEAAVREALKLAPADPELRADLLRVQGVQAGGGMMKTGRRLP